MRRIALGLCFVVLIITPVCAALKFPALTGRVVDDAHILSPQTITQLDATLADYEARTTNQLVVATMSSLQGTSIEDYGYQLGRTWGVGQKGKNNGLILLVAPKEHLVRIEVGYGLEGEFTDAKSSVIINSIILPNFRQGHMEQGVVAGVEALTGARTITATPGGHGQAGDELNAVWSAFVFGAFALIFIGRMIVIFNPRLILRYPFLAFLLLTSGGSSGGRGRDDFGGGDNFSGGGGSFGGGGASGKW